MPHIANYAHGRALPASTKRNIKAPNLSIREKQALRTAQTYPGQYQPQNQSQAQNYNNPYMIDIQQQMYRAQYQQRLQQQNNRQAHHVIRPQTVVPVYEAPKLRTRAAKKGPKIDIGSDESEDDAAIELESEGQDDTEAESDDESDKKGQSVQYLNFDRLALESRVLHYINEVSGAKELADLASCTVEIANFIISHRPFVTLDQIKDLDIAPDGKRPSRNRKTVGLKLVETSTEAMEGYEAIDSLVAKCEEYGRLVKDAIAQWGVDVDFAADQDGALDVVKIESTAAKASDIAYLTDQPVLLPDAVRLKDYQIFGVNWLHLMYQKELSGILADEMGLGKTCQVISFLGVLLHEGKVGPHLIVVPASTLENWLREISRFCPSLKVEAYYGSQRERNEFRDQFEGEKRDFNIMVTTYQLATGAKDDRSFLKRQSFDVCVYDEGHNLKNSSSSRYKYLMAVKANFRVLLTGTPLQNNLKELISLLSFVLPKVFAGNMERLDSIFKIKAFGDSETLESALLSQQRIKRAKTMMTPFILRRYKKDVLSDLPKKNYRIDYVELNEAQKALYNEHLGTSRKALEAKANGEELAAKDVKSAVNVMMQLRKCSNHPMLFRRQYNDRVLKKMAKAILQEEAFRDSVEALVMEDMDVMTDFELNRLCLRYPTIQRFALDQDCWMQACKVQHLQQILPKMKEAGDRILLFSQFTQTLDILEDCMDTMGITYFRLDGSTDVSTRQDLIDQFHEETDITVFLLSTKAGGFGINLACANVVIIYDSSFNPHDDKQAEDRAHRVGQTKEVQIIRLVAKNTIEEHIARLANTKLTLDSSVSGDLEIDSKTLEAQGERQIAQTLISQLKAQ
ncbi:Helicase SWR1 [Taphrina deformans PYCC 5710]|uniref:DNA helicase n=1 Tax=Taphrina deformans (strain PYCC 5710 / ATCC 11124 / CBS 356.35 / IMI 108563 / JCM 9778 / NBRC 8474) TaxID=1097556 RepID=R4X9V2_TAPDE|nr:Helicase SWR1 [Taphrina deformans PYCC 5710]|eukprot:CCG81019.1 Helicase SWR1 [Taphrina deformans PYCC 5710]